MRRKRRIGHSTVRVVKSDMTHRELRGGGGAPVGPPAISTGVFGHLRTEATTVAADQVVSGVAEHTFADFTAAPWSP